MRQVEREAGCLIFDDTIQEKEWTDENETMCWHYDHSKGRAVKGLTCSMPGITMAKYQCRSPLE
ncbi:MULTISPECIES: hypothetical protein [Nitrosomonas]|uniref:hypothetical protein n=1 Tax=Nitrosomonas TaxID=914 RepID=UPI001CA37756|nr:MULTISPECIES: hypothetical protein [Nitrosomonas]